MPQIFFLGGGDSDLTFDPPFKAKLVLATFNHFLYCHLYSEAHGH